MNASTPLSFEFFPPRDTAGCERLVSNVATKLAEQKPAFFSVTYGAGGSTRDGTQQTIRQLLEAGYDAAPHLSMGNDDRDDVCGMLDEYAQMGVKRIVALRGDQPSGFSQHRFSNNAEALVRLIREHSGDTFHIEVAAYPETHPDASSAAVDLDFFKRKIDAGANSAITQYFYSADAYEEFLIRCAKAGIEASIVPGIMPIASLEGILRFSQKCGADVPRWLRLALADLADDEKAVQSYAVEYLSRLCEHLITLGAPGLHFYTLNRWGATTRICENLS